MKYNLEVRAIAHVEEPIAKKHDSFLAGVAGVPAPWGFVSPSQAPDPGAELSVTLNLSKLLGQGLRGTLTYQYRRPFRDEGSQDDFLNLVFNPRKVNYRQLVESVFLSYVSAFNGYYAEISDDEFIFMDYEMRRKLRIDKRHQVYRVAPVSYVRKELCLSAFNRSPSEIVTALAGHAEEVREVLDGVLIILSYSVLPTPEMDKICRKAMACLGTEPEEEWGQV